MSFSKSVAALAALRLISAAPTSSESALERRRTTQGDIAVCKNSACSDCQLSVYDGSGYPDCTIYNTQQFKDAGYPVQDNGQLELFFDVPVIDPGCQILVRTPVVPDQNGGCGGNVLDAQGATCAPVLVDQTFTVLFCCGTEDCKNAGAAAKRSIDGGDQGLDGRTAPMLFKHRNGTIIPPLGYAVNELGELVSSAVEAEHGDNDTDVPSLSSTLNKRDCGSFTVTKEPYDYAFPENYRISDTVSCATGEACQVQMSGTVEKSFSTSVSVSVSDPFGIITASTSLTWEKSMSRTFSTTHSFPPGTRGYLEFIPIMTCVEGYFNGDCNGAGQTTMACAPKKNGQGEMTGEIRAVTVRG